MNELRKNSFASEGLNPEEVKYRFRINYYLALILNRLHRDNTLKDDPQQDFTPFRDAVQQLQISLKEQGFKKLYASNRFPSWSIDELDACLTRLNTNIDKDELALAKNESTLLKRIFNDLKPQ